MIFASQLTNPLDAVCFFEIQMNALDDTCSTGYQKLCIVHIATHINKTLFGILK